MESKVYEELKYSQNFRQCDYFFDFYDLPFGFTELMMPSIYKDSGLPLVRRSTKYAEISLDPVIFSWWNPVILKKDDFQNFLVGFITNYCIELPIVIYARNSHWIAFIIIIVDIELRVFPSFIIKFKLQIQL